MAEEALADIVDEFYRRVRGDSLLAPVFDQVVADWPGHLHTLTIFWRSILLGTGEYKGRPVPAHHRHRAMISPDMFDRWLSLWAQTVDEMAPAPTAAILKQKAERIGESIKLALFFRIETAPTVPGHTK